MLQWMGGSRKKVTTSRKSTQKRQKQYFEQRKRQQQYHQQTTGLDNYDDEMNLTEEHHKEHRSLDVMNLLNLSKITQECRSACSSGRKDLGDNASKVEFDVSNGSLVIQSGTIVQPADSDQFKEARIPSASQMEAESPKKNYCYSPNGHPTRPDQWVKTNEQPMSVLDLLADDGLIANMEGNTVYEDHVAFSVQGLGRVGAQTPVHSPQRPTRAFAYDISSPNKVPGKLNLSKKFNSLLDDLDSEVDARMEDINIPLDSNNLYFSSDYMDLLSSAKQKSFTLRDARQHDGRSSKKNRNFDRDNEDKWDDRSHLQYDSFFDETDHDLSWKTRKSRKDDIVADNLTYRAYDSPDFAFESPQISIRPAEKVTDKFDILGSTSPFSKHETSEYGCNFLVSNWSRNPTVERKFNHIHETNKPEHFTAVQEDARENSSMYSEESCSSTAVRYQASDDSISKATSRHSSRRGNDEAFSGSRDEHIMKPFAEESKKYDGPPENIASGPAKRTKMLDSSDFKQPRQSSSFFQENLEPKGNWFSEERFTEVDINPSSRSKHTGFDSDLWDEDPFCKSPAPKSQIGANHQRSGFLASSPPSYFTPMNITAHDYSPMVSKPELPLDSRFTAVFQSENISPDTSAQESISKDVQHDAKFKPSSYQTFHPGEEIFARNESVVSGENFAADASNSMSNDHEAKEPKDQTARQLNTAFLPNLVDGTSPSTIIANKSRTTDTEKECVSQRNGDHHTAYKSPCSYQSGKKENVEDFGTKERMGYKQKSDYFDSPRQAMILQSYVFQLFCVQKRLQC